MDFKVSAFKHGEDPADIEHAVRNPVRTHDLIDDAVMIVGPARDARLLEVGVNAKGAVFHAMAARYKYL